MYATEDDRRLVGDVLDSLQVTDRIFHGLKRTVPLVEHLVGAVRRQGGSSRVLVVGANSLLAKALDALGLEVELWNVPEGNLIGEVRHLVTRTAPLDEFLADVESAASFDVVVLPYVLESAGADPASVLALFRRHLVTGGRIIVATKSAGQLAHRLRGLRGLVQVQVSSGSAASSPIPLSWPALPTRRLLDHRELRIAATGAGCQIDDIAFVMDTAATISIDAMRVTEWLAAEMTHLVKKKVPGLQDCLVARLAPFPVQSRQPFADAERPAAKVSVVAFAEDPTRAQRLLSDLDEQAYPPECVDVVLLHPPDAGFAELDQCTHKFTLRTISSSPAIGPLPANIGVESSVGDIVAFTDDRCRLLPHWIESGVAALSGWTAAATGDVVSEGVSLPPYLALPGQRATRGDDPDLEFFPASNSFYVKEALLHVGGFDASSQSTEPSWGWDSEPAYNLAKLGYPTAFDDSLFVLREFPPPNTSTWLKQEYRKAVEIPGAFRRTPQLARAKLKQRIFLTNRTRAFALMILGSGAALIRRRPVYALLGLPWARNALKLLDIWPPALWADALRTLKALTTRHLVWLAGFVVGSAKARRWVL